MTEKYKLNFDLGARMIKTIKKNHDHHQILWIFCCLFSKMSP